MIANMTKIIAVSFKNGLLVHAPSHCNLEISGEDYKTSYSNTHYSFTQNRIPSVFIPEATDQDTIRIFNKHAETQNYITENKVMKSPISQEVYDSLTDALKLAYKAGEKAQVKVYDDVELTYYYENVHFVPFLKTHDVDVTFGETELSGLAHMLPCEIKVEALSKYIKKIAQAVRNESPRTANIYNKSVLAYRSEITFKLYEESAPTTYKDVLQQKQSGGYYADGRTRLVKKTRKVVAEFKITNPLVGNNYDDLMSKLDALLDFTLKGGLEING